MLTEVVLPLIGLGALAWAMPALMARILPEGVGWLVVNGIVSTLAMALVSMAVFVALYGEAGGPVFVEAPGHFVLLAARSALIWAPVLVLSLADRPRRWTQAEW
jgi:hypothetical protein